MASRQRLFQLFQKPVVLSSIATGVAAVIVARNTIKPVLADSAYSDLPPPKEVFRGGPAFQSLSLESSEIVNHNTKSLRFKLPSENDVSGLGLTWGAGITPIYQLAQGILNNPDDKTKMTLVVGVNSDQDVLLKDQFARFEKEYPGQFRAVYTVSNPGPASPFRKGYVTKDLLKETVSPVTGQDTRVFVCGPPAMEKALVGTKGTPGILREMGYRSDQIHKF